MVRCAALLMAASCLAAQTGGFTHLATYKGLGGLVASAVGPGRGEGSQRFYLSYLYIDNTIDVVGVDPDSGEFEVYANPASTESGARCMVAGPDGKLYLGTLPRAHFLELDPKAGTLKDLGRPSPTEQYIWDVAFGPDGRLYGATYPQSKLVRYDPATGALEDLGRMDPVEQYAHYVAGSDDGFMYVGIGTSRANIAAYEIATGEHREILPPEFQTVGQASVYRGQDGKVYGILGSRYFRLEGWTCTAITSKEASPAVPKNRLADGRTVSVSGRTIRTTDAQRRTTERHFAYEGNELPMFRIGFGPDGVLYGSSVLPIHFLRLDAENGAMAEIGDLGGGEIYSFLARGPHLLMAAYSGLAPLMVWDPQRAFNTGGGDKNPVLVNFQGSDSGWRPQAFINGPGGRVYIGSVAGYGKLGGPLTVWDLDNGVISEYPHVVADQSVVSLAVWNGLIVGGATVGGGGGSHPTQKEARIFLWDPETREKLWEGAAVRGATSITDLIVTDNLVYGIAGRTLFCFDPEAREIKFTKSTPFTSAIYNSVGLGPGGKIWGLASTGIFTIDPETGEVAMAALTPKAITAGFELRDGAVYFVCGPQLWRYDIAEAEASGGTAQVKTRTSPSTAQRAARPARWRPPR